VSTEQRRLGIQDDTLRTLIRGYVDLEDGTEKIVAQAVAREQTARTEIARLTARVTELEAHVCPEASTSTSATVVFPFQKDSSTGGDANHEVTA
jgi:hypothetical protein